MAKFFKYRAHVTTEPSVEETIFERLDPDAPAVPARYVHDPGKFGKFKDGREYKLDPEAVEAEAEEHVAEVQIGQATEEAAMKEAVKSASGKAAKKKSAGKSHK